MDTTAVDVSGIDLEGEGPDLTRRVSSSLALSGLSGSPSWPRAAGLSRSTTAALFKQLKPFNTEDIKILLLENVNQTGVELLKGQGYQVTILKSSLAEDELIEKIRCGNLNASDCLCPCGLTGPALGTSTS